MAQRWSQRVVGSVATGVAERVHRRGFVVRRHPAVRRQAMLAQHGVDVVLDVGAARGSYGCELRDFGFTGTIVSFEPMRGPFAQLSSSVGRDEKWHAHRLALGASPGVAQINVASNSDSSSLLPFAASHREAAPDVEFVTTEEIEVARLDDLAAPYVGDDTRAFLKIDTQGFEKEVLAGGPAVLRRCVGLQLELSFVPTYEGGMLVDEAVSWAYGEGFRLVGIDPGFASPSGQVLQADGVFVRDLP